MVQRLFRGVSVFVLLVGFSLVAPAALFEPLFLVEKVVGAVTIEKPDGTVVKAELDHAYPYGSKICVPEPPPPYTPEETKRLIKQYGSVPVVDPPMLRIRFSDDFAFRFSAGTKVGILDASEKTGDRIKEVKILDLSEGVIDTFLSASVVKTGGAADEKIDAILNAIVIRTPVGEATKLSARNRVSVKRAEGTPGYSSCLFRTQSGNMEIAGAQFHIQKMRANSEAILDGDAEFTSINVGRGEFTVRFERGADDKQAVHFSGRTVGKVWRQYCDIGGRQAFAVMICNSDGTFSSYSYLEGQTGISGAIAATAQSTSEKSGDAASDAADDFGDTSSSDDFSFDSFDDSGSASGAASETTDSTSSSDSSFDDNWLDF